MSVDERLVCTYDESHVIDPLRMPRHLMKCRKNHPGMEMAICPFNACHEVKKQELRYHMMHCPNRDLLNRDVALNSMRQLVYESSGLPMRGYTDLPRYEDKKFDHDEDWEDGRRYQPNFSAYHESRRPGASRRSDDASISLRRPTTGGKAVQLANSRSDSGAASPDGENKRTVFDFSLLSAGRGRARPGLPPSSNPAVSQTNATMLRPNPLPSMLSLGRGRGVAVSKLQQQQML